MRVQAVSRVRHESVTKKTTLDTDVVPTCPMLKSSTKTMSVAAIAMEKIGDTACVLGWPSVQAPAGVSSTGHRLDNGLG